MMSWVNPRSLAWILWAAAVVPALAAIAIFLTIKHEPTEAMNAAVTTLLLPSIGAVIASRRPDNALGWLICGVAMSLSASYLGDVYATYPASAHHLPAQDWMGILSGVGFFPSFITLFTFVLLLFPSGTLLSHRWRLLAWLAGACVIAILLHEALAVEFVETDLRNPIYVPAVAQLMRPLTFVAYIAVFVTFAGSVLSLTLRFRRSHGVERQQLKWFVYVTAMSAAAFACSIILSILDSNQNDGGIVGVAFWIAASLGLGIGIPCVICLAILRYRLFEIDRIINRTLVYGALTTTLALIYLILVIGLGGLVRAATGASSNLVVAASTLAVAGLFQPIRHRIQTTVDRRFYRRKYDATRTLETFSARLRDEIDLDALLAELGGVVQETMQPTHVSLWLSQGEER